MSESLIDVISRFDQWMMTVWSFANSAPAEDVAEVHHCFNAVAKAMVRMTNVATVNGPTAS